MRIVRVCIAVVSLVLGAGHSLSQTWPGVITTIAGNGSGSYLDGARATQTGLGHVAWMAVDAAGNIYLTDQLSGSYGILMLSARTGTLKSLSYSWYEMVLKANGRDCNQPSTLLVDATGRDDTLYVVCNSAVFLVKVPLKTLVPEVLPFDDTSGTNLEGLVAKDPAGAFYFTTGTCAGCLSRMDPVTGLGTKMVVKSGAGALISQPLPSNLTSDAIGNLYAYDYNRIWKIVLATGKATVLAGNGQEGYSGDGGPANKATIRISGLAVSPQGDVYISDVLRSSVRRIDAATGMITTVAGTGIEGERGQGFSGDGGPAKTARLNYPMALAVDRTGDLYISDTGNHRVRKVTWSERGVAPLMQGVAVVPVPAGTVTTGHVATAGAVAQQSSAPSKKDPPVQVKIYRASPKGYAEIENHSQASLTAVVFRVQWTDQSIVQNFDMRLLRRPPVAGGGITRTPIGRTPAEMIVGGGLLAAVFADGTSYGDPADIGDMMGRREIKLEMFQAILPKLCAEVGTGADLETAIASLDRAHDGWINIPSSASKADILKEEAFQFVKQKLKQGQMTAGWGGAAHAKVIQQTISDTQSYAAELLADPVRATDGRLYLAQTAASFACSPRSDEGSYRGAASASSSPALSTPLAATVDQLRTTVPLDASLKAAIVVIAQGSYPPSVWSDWLNDEISVLRFRAQGTQSQPQANISAALAMNAYAHLRKATTPRAQEEQALTVLIARGNISTARLSIVFRQLEPGGPEDVSAVLGSLENAIKQTLDVNINEALRAKNP